MSRAYLALLLVSCVWAQSPGSFIDKAPPDVEEALRARITAFYQDHVDKKFRQAEEYVAADTKDFYYGANKPAYLAFEITKITYSDNFTNAKAVVTCKIRFPAPGFEQIPMTAPVPSTWKLENGQWYWYVDQKAGRETPFGVMPPPAAGTAPTGNLPSLASAPSVEALWKSVQADKNAVQLNAREPSSDLVKISNKMPGNIWLQIDAPKTPGLEIAVDRGELKSGEEAKITFHSEPQEKPVSRVAQVRVTVLPTNQVIPITVAIR